MAEEHRAWDYGRAALEALGWTDWVAYEREKTRALATYSRTPPAGPPKPWVVRRETEDGKIVARFVEGAMREAVGRAFDENTAHDERIGFFVRYELPMVGVGTVPGAHWFVRGRRVLALLPTQETEATLGLPFERVK